MAGEVVYTWKDGRLYVAWIGDLGLDELIGLIQYLQSLEAEHPAGFDRLHDLSAAGELTADFNAILHMATNRRQFHDALPVARRAAFVTTHDLHLGMVRMYQTMMEDSNLEVRTFATVTEAEDWLDTPQESPG